MENRPQRNGMESSRKVSPRTNEDARGAPTVYISVAETYSYQSSLNSSSINNKMIYPCHFCNYQTPYAANLRRHVINKHIRTPQLYSCHLCNYKSERRYNLRVHMHNIHKFDDTHEAGTQEAGSQTDDSMQPTFQIHKFDDIQEAGTQEAGSQTDDSTQSDFQIHKFEDTQEAGTQESGSQTYDSTQPTFQKADASNLVNEAFDVFQNYMRMKMQLTDSMSEEMIVECIDVSKYVMKKKLSEQNDEK